MSRTRTAVLAAVLVTGAVGAPAAFAAPACDEPGADVVHEVHEAGEALPVAGTVASGAAHEVEEAYCGL